MGAAYAGAARADQLRSAALNRVHRGGRGPKTSKYTGVSWQHWASGGRWTANLMHEGKVAYMTPAHACMHTACEVVFHMHAKRT